MRLCKRTVTIPKPLYGEVKEYIYRRLDQPQLDQQVPLGIFFHHGFFVQKKDVFFLRLSIDYRELKRKTRPERQPILRIQRILNDRWGDKWFTVLDPGKAYHYHQGFVAEISLPLAPLPC